MATDRERDPLEDESTTPAESLWMKTVLGAERVGEFGGEAAEGRDGQERRALQALLQDCRSELQRDSLQDESRAKFLAQRILNNTVREDLSVRADWRLVGRFVQQRLAASGLLRVVAASLLLHLFALPVMAYYVWLRPAPEHALQIRLGPEEVDLPYGILEPEVLQGPEPNGSTPLGIEDLVLLNDLFRAHRLAEGHGEVGPADQVLWSGDLGLVLRMEMLNARGLEGADSDAHRARVQFTRDQLELCLERLREDRTRPALRQLAASAWLRARNSRAQDANQALEHGLREFELRSWLGSAGPLEGKAWRAACERAETETNRDEK